MSSEALTNKVEVVPVMVFGVEEAAVVMVGAWLTVTETEEVVEPPRLVAVKIYVVLVDGAVEVFEPVTVPIPWLIERLVAFETFHERIVELPILIEFGVAVKELMVGGGVVLIVTVEVEIKLAFRVLVTLT